MQGSITFEDVKNAFWDWQCWWIVAKSTGEIEDMRAVTLAGLNYTAICEKFIVQHKGMSLDERQMFESFIVKYKELAREEDGEEVEAEI